MTKSALKLDASDEFTHWYRGLDDDEAESVNASVDLLEKAGPTLGKPHVDTPKGAQHAGQKELRVQHKGKQLKIPITPGPERTSHLVMGGGTTASDDWSQSTS